MRKKASMPERKLVILSPKPGEITAIQTDLQYRYACGKCIEPVLQGEWVEKKWDFDASHPEPVTVKWDNPFGKKCLLSLSENAKFSPAKKWQALRSRKIYNLIPGRQYFLKVTCGRHCSETVSFSTGPQSPRFIHVPGVTNVRDIGGLTTCSGKKIRFGMVYRGAQHDKWSSVRGISQTGKSVLRNDLKLKTILDLRWWTEGKRPMEKAVRKYVNLPILAYATWHGPTNLSLGIFTEEQMDHVRRIFLLLAEKNSYPLYFHCQGGGDRTGTIAFLLETALGVSQPDAEKEYEYSNLSISGIRLRTAEVWVKFMNRLDEFAPGKSIQEKVSAYLYQCGIKEETLEKIRQILLEA